ncbi:MAG: hypothetical protein DVB23_002801 [Verrucomicrobia bacterium]|jgi:hypothetical protein|nr:MAG: hypothetical protein DVB23_002801 [Verrucomicrobiota bacterium]
MNAISLTVSPRQLDLIQSIAADLGFVHPSDLLEALASDLCAAEEDADGPLADAISGWLQYRMEAAA